MIGSGLTMTNGRLQSGGSDPGRSFGTDTDTAETDRQADRQTNAETDRQTNAETDRQTYRQMV